MWPLYFRLILQGQYVQALALQWMAQRRNPLHRLRRVGSAGLRAPVD
uniref:Uncharacterized protein n=1 Tax=Anguilla anguilla TaxID=7936 RepID=A0A0E9SNB5_ANGAN